MSIRFFIKVSGKSFLLQIIVLATSLALLSAEIDSLSPLPGLDACKEENSFDEHDTPFPANASVLEHLVVDDRDIESREDSNESSNNSPEEEFVSPDVDSPLSEILRALRLHAEERTETEEHEGEG